MLLELENDWEYEVILNAISKYNPSQEEAYGKVDQEKLVQAHKQLLARLTDINDSPTPTSL